MYVLIHSPTCFMIPSFHLQGARQSQWRFLPLYPLSLITMTKVKKVLSRKRNGDSPRCGLTQEFYSPTSRRSPSPSPRLTTSTSGGQASIKAWLRLSPARRCWVGYLTFLASINFQVFQTEVKIESAPQVCEN